MHLAIALLAIVPTLAGSAPPEFPRRPLLRTIDLDIGESREVEDFARPGAAYIVYLPDGGEVGVHLAGGGRVIPSVTGSTPSKGRSRRASRWPVAAIRP